MDETATYFSFQMLGQCLCVVGPDLVSSTAFIYITSVIDFAEVATAGASFQFIVAFANVAGPALSTVTYASLMKPNREGSLFQEETKNNDHFLDSLRAAFWLWAALCFAGEPRILPSYDPELMRPNCSCNPHYPDFAKHAECPRERRETAWDESVATPRRHGGATR